MSRVSKIAIVRLKLRKWAKTFSICKPLRVSNIGVWLVMMSTIILNLDSLPIVGTVAKTAPF